MGLMCINSKIKSKKAKFKKAFDPFEKLDNDLII
jgi:uncharacterized protein YdcH (DUF465 family)